MYAQAPRSQADLRHHNLMIVYSLVRDEGPISRAALAKHTGLSATSMTRIVSALCSMGLVAEQAVQASPRMGRPSTLLEIRPNAAYCLCVDTAVTGCRVAITDLSKKIAGYREIPLHFGTTFEELVAGIEAVLPGLMNEVGIEKSKLLCCGMSVTGHVLHTESRIVASSQFQWFDIEAGRILEERLGMPAFVENDCKAALIGEESLLQAESRSVENLAYMEFGWGGVGSAAIIDGRLLRGSSNAAGEIGHMNACPNGDVCNCGHIGCFETMISEQSVIRKAQKIAPSLNTLENLSRAANAGDARAQALIDEVGDYVALAINDISCSFNPDLIILNGGLVMNCRGCMEAVRENLKKRLVRSIQPGLEVRVAKMGNNAALYGVGCIAVEAITSRLLQNTESAIEGG